MIGPPYCPFFVYDMSDADMDWAYDSRPTRLDMHEVPHPVLFSGECVLYSRAREANGMFQSTENTHCTQEMEHRRPHLDFDGPVIAATYSAMLETWLKPQLRNRRHMDGI